MARQRQAASQNWFRNYAANQPAVRQADAQKWFRGFAADQTAAQQIAAARNAPPAPAASAESVLGNRPTLVLGPRTFRPSDDPAFQAYRAQADAENGYEAADLAMGVVRSNQKRDSDIAGVNQSAKMNQRGLDASWRDKGWGTGGGNGMWTRDTAEAEAARLGGVSAAQLAAVDEIRSAQTAADRNRQGRAAEIASRAAESVATQANKYAGYGG